MAQRTGQFASTRPAWLGTSNCECPIELASLTFRNHGAEYEGFWSLRELYREFDRRPKAEYPELSAREPQAHILCISES